MMYGLYKVEVRLPLILASLIIQSDDKRSLSPLNPQPNLIASFTSFLKMFEEPSPNSVLVESDGPSSVHSIVHLHPKSSPQ